MSHLIAIAVGPVQEFIAAARRTRDLWFGSYLLSEISRAVANSVEQHGGILIFPASSNPEKAENVANVILAELTSDKPEDVATAAKLAAKACWRKFADQAYQDASGAILFDVWKEQIDDVIEFYAAWVPRTASYNADRASVMRLLAGRKNCRDFLPAKGRAGLPKSSLDGQRETVLLAPENWPKRLRARLRIREGEQLDAVGLVKRVWGGTQPYPSVSRVAADPWVRGNEQKLAPVISECERLGSDIIRSLDTKNHPHFALFPFEGTAVYTTRHHELLEEAAIESERLHSLREALAKLPDPNPYLAVLVADGDNMGAAISDLKSAEENRAFSTALAGFADQASTLVNAHKGVLVYAGGDDVLAFLPVDKCLDCARKLHDSFGETMKRYDSRTLSVGIAIGHFMENLEDLLEYGRAAEKDSKKPDRDGLAVHLYKRGGVPIHVRSRWKCDPDLHLTHYAQLINAGAIPGKLSYDLLKLVQVYQKWPGTNLKHALQLDVLRVIHDKHPRTGQTNLAKVKNLVHERLTDADSLRRFAEELLVARQFATALEQAGAKRLEVTDLSEATP